MHILDKSKIIGAICLGIFALSFIINKSINLRLFDILAILFWIAIALILIKKPRGMAFPIAILAFGSVALQYHYLNSAIDESNITKNIEVSPRLWVNFWLSVMPLILGGAFAMLSFWNTGNGDRDLQIIES